MELNNIDTKKDGVYNPVDSRTSRREPDAVVWIDNDHFATANEGDYKLKGYEGTHKRGGVTQYLFCVSVRLVGALYVGHH